MHYQDNVIVHDQININNISYTPKRRQESRKRIGEIGIENEILLSLPEDGPSCYFKKFSNDGRVQFQSMAYGLILILYSTRLLINIFTFSFVSFCTLLGEKGGF